MIIYVMRHGQTEENTRWILNDDPKRVVHLNSEGSRQSEEAAEKLKRKSFRAVFTSEFARTIETAEIVNKYHHAPLIIDSRINERKTGFDGKHVSEFVKNLKDRFNTKPPKGESWQEEKERIRSFLDDLKTRKYGSVLIVTHGEPMMHMAGYFRKLTDEEMWKLEIDNCDIMEFEV